MNRAANILIGIGFWFAGIYLILDFIGLTPTGTNITIESLLLFYGLVLVITSMNKFSRGKLFLGVLLFFSGLVLLIVNEFEILNPIKVVLPSILAAFGTATFLLFIENTRERVHLYISLLLISISILLIVLFGGEKFYITANRVSFIILEFWPVLLTLTGLGILLNRNYR